MAPLALAIFILIFAFGAKLLGWHDPDGHVRIALLMSFLAGALCGYRAR